MGATVHRLALHYNDCISGLDHFAKLDRPAPNPEEDVTIRWTRSGGSTALTFRNFTCRRSVIGADYEVLGLQVTVATVFGNCFGAYIFSWSFSRCQQRSRGDVRSPYVANIEPTQWMAPVAFVHELQGIVIPPTLLRNCQG